MAIVNSYVNVYQAGYMDLLGIESFDHRQRKRSVTIGDEDFNSVWVFFLQSDHVKEWISTIYRSWFSRWFSIYRSTIYI